MLKLGVFEGKYMCDCVLEYPKEWFVDAKLSPSQADVKMNCFGIKSRQSLKEWQKNGWLYKPDPRGWFEWYCRYYLGRRILDIDAIQIKRWKAFYRHKAQLLKAIDAAKPSEKAKIRPKQRQALLQWAYNDKQRIFAK